ncbi:MAG: hypothetical protein VXW89_01435 [Candidatus Thermoplasmatota archaeon]|nr:hypothetical protein [Candidatus Thermoplasmatota archaeon]MEC7390920.1 hypothetical protein [Candidatus Thermoplasmatota archaeon]MEC7601341.1 hypothetical protein [Candidatus Thermoplasmatota archaeon]MEC9173499.1 hypothetical protein [Candidatus Thermoplasmatota archaeon]
MPHRIEALRRVPCESRVRACDLARDGSLLIWTDDACNLHYLNLDGDGNGKSFPLEEEVDHLLCLSNNSVLVGTISRDAHCISEKGEILWRINAAGGIEQLVGTIDRTRFLAIDGMRAAILFESDGNEICHHTGRQYILSAIRPDGGAFALADDTGVVELVSSTGKIITTKQPRSSEGDRITAMTFRPDGVLVIASECNGLTDSETPQIALDCISNNGEHLHTVEIDSNASVLFGTTQGILVGMENGDVEEHKIGKTEPIIWAKTGYEVKDVRPHDDDIIVGSWFHLRRYLSPMEEAWSIEHPGLIDRVSSDSGGRMIAISGDNRNDYTRIDRIDLYNPDSQRFEIEDDDALLIDDQDLFGGAVGGNIGTDLTDALENTENATNEDFEEIEDLLTEEEMEIYRTNQASEDDLDDLLSELEKDVDSEHGNISQNEGIEDLIEGIIDDDSFSSLPPIADAGQDRVIDVDEDGTAMVTLDGRSSQCSDGEIESWEWRDSAGLPIGDTSALKVRLRPGTHQFTLSVLSSKGMASSDSVTVQIKGEQESDDSFDVLLK